MIKHIYLEEYWTERCLIIQLPIDYHNENSINWIKSVVVNCFLAQVPVDTVTVSYS